MKCLVVEDNLVMREFVTACLVDLGHCVTAFGSAAEALRILKTQKFDLLIVDYKLSDGTSVPIIDYFGATCPNSRVIFLTGSGIFPNGETSIFAPVVDWTLRKPVEPRDPQAIVDYAEVEMHGQTEPSLAVIC